MIQLRTNMKPPEWKRPIRCAIFLEADAGDAVPARTRVEQLQQIAADQLGFTPVGNTVGQERLILQDVPKTTKRSLSILYRPQPNHAGPVQDRLRTLKRDIKRAAREVGIDVIEIEEV